MTQLGSRRRAVVGPSVVGAARVLSAATVALAVATPSSSTSIEIVIRYSRFEPSSITVPAGVPVTITLRNDDPIDHEWIVGDESVHAIHRVGTEPLHPTRPTEVVLPAGQTRTTTIVFETAGSMPFICHLPGHEAYGMVGMVAVR